MFKVWYTLMRCYSLQANGVVGLHDLLQDLLQEYALEQEPGKKRELLERTLDSIEAGWEQLFLSLSKEENPQRALLLLTEFNRVLKLRRSATEEANTPQTK